LILCSRVCCRRRESTYFIAVFAHPNHGAAAGINFLNLR
jgi:hypothetical protein